MHYLSVTAMFYFSFTSAIALCHHKCLLNALVMLHRAISNTKSFWGHKFVLSWSYTFFSFLKKHVSQFYNSPWATLWSSQDLEGLYKSLSCYFAHLCRASYNLVTESYLSSDWCKQGLLPKLLSIWVWCKGPCFRILTLNKCNKTFTFFLETSVSTNRLKTLFPFILQQVSK